MIAADGMTAGLVRCDACGATARPGASCQPGMPCHSQRTQFSRRCAGTWRTKDELEARQRAATIDRPSEESPCPST